MKCSAQRGFTALELLVALAIMATLVASLLPVVSRAREMARSSACQNNVRSLGFSTWNYASDNTDQLVKAYQLTTAAGLKPGRFIHGMDNFALSATHIDTTLTGSTIPRAGLIRLYADILLDGDYLTSPYQLEDPGRPASFTLLSLTDRRYSRDFPAFRDRTDAGVSVAKYLVNGYGIGYQASLMLDDNPNNITSVRKSSSASLTGSAATNWGNATYRNAWNYYTAGSGDRHMRVSSRPYPSENMWLTCMNGANGGPYAMTPWGYPQLSPFHPSSNPNGGVNSVFFDGHAETVRRDHIYAGTGAGPEAPTMNGTNQMRSAAGADGNQWADPTIYPNFRPRFWDIRNTTPLGGTNVQNMDLRNMQTGTVTP